MPSKVKSNAIWAAGAGAVQLKKKEVARPKLSALQDNFAAMGVADSRR